MDYIVNAKIGERLVICRISPNRYSSRISGALLKKYEMDCKKIPSIRGKRITVKFNIPITFQSGEESITINSKLEVGDDFCVIPMIENEINLGMNWLMGRPLNNETLASAYSTKIVHRFISDEIIPYLSIKCEGKKLALLLSIDNSDDCDCSSDSS